MPIVNLNYVQQFSAVNLTADPGYDAADRTIPNCVAVVLVWVMDDGKTGRNVMHARYQSGFTPSTAIANSILTGLCTGGAWTAMEAFLSTTSVFTAVLLRDLNTKDQPFVPSNVGGGVGTSASPALPNEVAACITLRTALVGPANRGRIYVPGFATNALGAGNVIAATAVTAIQNWAQTIPTVLNGQGLTFSIGQYHRLAYTGTGGKPHPERLAGTVPITSQTMRDNHWDSQRRRGLK